MTAPNASRRRKARRRPAGAPGFTLIEVIIALTLMSLIMLGLVSAFATLGKTAARLDAHAGKSGREWLLGEFLRATLSSSVGQQIKRRLPDQSEAIHFRGGPAMLQWLGSMPARYGVGGLHLFLLETEPGESGARLMLHYAPYIKDAPPGAATDSVQVLAEHLADIRITYQSHPTRPDEEATWHESWEDPENLPARVRIELTATDGAAWPPMLVTVGALDAVGGRRVRAGQVSPSPPSRPQPSP
ncbi:MAG: prepilin-type N-terminal cleavage/methylation domain-containing protein [Azoarcus sp.]|jgi:general secretion pathway protein J|nr:prepilin-type N-terminal cleavage/methylation domain-containing protein [Azoarcus sp.]